MATTSPTDLTYRLPCLDNVENVEKYRSGGYHPIHLGDTSYNGMYCVLHKLGYGRFPTVWLARDEARDRLVSLKVLTAEASRESTEVKLLRRLDEKAQGNSGRDNIITCLDDFKFEGTNGTHLCYVSQPGGPSISAILDSPGEIAGTHRLRAPLARRLARQLAKAVSFIHVIGIVHGDITPKNVLLQLSDFDTWPTEAVYQLFGHPVREQIFRISGQQPDPSAPEYLVEPVSFSCFDLEYFLWEILVIDLGEAFPELSPPPKGVGTPVSYRSPELILESKASKASDIWALACTIFEMRSGFPLFESFVGSSTDILDEMVRILGVPPGPSHPLRKQDMITIPDLADLNGFTLHDRIREIGVCDEESFMHTGNIASLDHLTLLEPHGASINTDEANDLSDSLQRTLDYTPQTRWSAEKVANHSWLVNNQ